MSNDKRQLLFELMNEVRRSQNATERFDRAVGEAIGLNRTDMHCLDVIDREGSVPAGRLAEVTGLTSGAITTALDRLERAGYTRRVRDASDRRRVLVEPTTQAREITARFYGSHAELAESLQRRYTREQLELLIGFLREGSEFNELHAGEVERENRSKS
jgi:DNA-binding MarR family transcriptional regulator